MYLIQKISIEYAMRKSKYVIIISLLFLFTLYFYVESNAKDKMYVYNYHYQNYKKSVDKGFDYRIFSDSFIEFKDEHFFIDLLYDVNCAK